MKIFNIEEASKTILKRKALHRMEYSPLIIQRTEEFFGAGITPSYGSRNHSKLRGR